jgi:hypothetical protein
MTSMCEHIESGRSHEGIVDCQYWDCLFPCNGTSTKRKRFNSSTSNTWRYNSQTLWETASWCSSTSSRYSTNSGHMKSSPSLLRWCLPRNIFWPNIEVDFKIDNKRNAAQLKRVFRAPIDGGKCGFNQVSLLRQRLPFQN